MAGYYGTDGNNNVVGGGWSEYYTGNGEDIATGNTISPDFYMGEGNDVAAAGGLTGRIGSGVSAGNPLNYSLAVQLSATGSNWMEGGSERDLLIGLDGSDSLFGGLGDDSGIATSQSIWFQMGLYGGSGNDWLDGGLGNDFVDGGSENDTLMGGDGADSLYGGSGNDLIYADIGLDFVDAGADNDTVYTGVSNAGNVDLGSGNDTFGGGNANDTVYGGTGADVFNMGGGVDLVNGAGGTDLIYGGQGSDLLYGGANTDYFVMELDIKPGDFDYIGDFTVGGASADYVLLSASMNGYVYFGESGGTAYGVLGIGGGYYGFAAAGVSAAQLQAQTLFI
jgi:Ca2+-binding RTX toxin-like protein